MRKKEMNEKNPSNKVVAISDKMYALTLLLTSLEKLAQDLAIEHDSNPDSIVAQVLLNQSLELQYHGTNKALCLLETRYGDLMDTLTKLIS